MAANKFTAQDPNERRRQVMIARRGGPDDFFWPRVKKSEGCWEWQGWTNHKRYGQFQTHAKNWKAHRFAWTLTHGPIPDGLMVCHRCDNPRCCNPAHLFLGTNSDNQRDAVSKGRASVLCLNQSRTSKKGAPETIATDDDQGKGHDDASR